jgi:hypothetical protein
MEPKCLRSVECCTLEPRFSIYFSSRNTKPCRTYSGTPACPQYVKYKIKYQQLFVFYVQYQLLTSNRSLTWSFRLTHGLSIARCADWLDCRIRKLLDWAAIDCVRAVCGGMWSHEFWFVHTNVGPPITLFRHYAHPSLGTADTLLRNFGVPLIGETAWLNFRFVNTWRLFGWTQGRSKRTPLI